MKKATKVQDELPETPEPPQIMHPNSAAEREKKMQTPKKGKKKQGTQ